MSCRAVDIGVARMFGQVNTLRAGSWIPHWHRWAARGVHWSAKMTDRGRLRILRLRQTAGLCFARLSDATSGRGGCDYELRRALYGRHCTGSEAQR